MYTDNPLSYMCGSTLVKCRHEFFKLYNQGLYSECQDFLAIN